MNSTQIQILSAWILGALAIATISTLIRHFKIQQDIRRLNDEPEQIRWHSIKEDQMWRAWLTINDPDYMRRGVDFHWEVVWGKKARSVGSGFRIHFGDRGSETPFHFDILLGFVAIFFSMNTPNMGKFFEKIGRGQKRDISVRAHSGQLWWDMWYSDDDGYNNAHNHKNSHEPWPWWPWRHQHYRPWKCPRHGSIKFNPLTVWWGPRFFNYTTIDEDVLLINIGQFPNDEYMVEFKVQHCIQQRRRGPWFARRQTDKGYTAEWSIPEGETPIPTKGVGRGHFHGSAVSIPDPLDWRMDADDNLKAWVIKERERAGFKTPEEMLKTIKSITPIFDSMQGKLLGLGEAAGKAGVSLKKFAVEFEERMKKDGGMILIPEGSEMTMTPLDNEELKAKYTPAELAQQAINRDKED